MYSNNRDAYRQFFFTTWQKYQSKLELEAIEMQLIEIMLLHPEYHVYLNKPSVYQNQEFPLEENPFFHMSLHLTLYEQLKTKRPLGIITLYQNLLRQFNDRHHTEHCMMNCLAESMLKAQQTGVTPDEKEYLQKLQSLIK